jgi:hypothetical protein
MANLRVRRRAWGRTYDLADAFIGHRAAYDRTMSGEASVVLTMQNQRLGGTQ